MNFNSHSNYTGRHALLSPSDYHWLNYDEEKLTRVFHSKMAAARGTDLHNLGFNLIRLGVRLPDTMATLNQYVNDAIGFRMTPEVMLVYSENCFGHADCLGFRDNILRVSDLKTGVTPASPHQLEIYAALFCLEYKFNPFDIGIELRIYQNDSVQLYVPEVDGILHIIDKITSFDKRIRYLREEVSS